MNKITAPQKVRLEILRLAVSWFRDESEKFSETAGTASEFRAELEKNKNDGEAIDSVFERESVNWQLQDATDGFRGRGEVSNIEAPWSRHYEAKSKCFLTDDGSWIGWTYWYGGGKHGNPEQIEWIEDAYYLDFVSEEYIVKRTFKKSDVV